MDGIQAPDLWSLVFEVFHSSQNQTNKTKDDREPRRNLLQGVRNKEETLFFLYFEFFKICAQRGCAKACK